MVEASNYEKDLHYAAQIPCMILSALGAWPLPVNASFPRKLVKLLQNLTCYFLYLFILIPGFLRIFLKESQWHIRLKILTPLVTCSTSMTKYSIILYRGAEISKSLMNVREDWKNGTVNRNIMLLKAKLGRKLVLLSAAFVYGGGVPFRLLPLMKGRILLPDNTTFRLLACPSYFVIFDEQITPMYEIVFTLQFLAGLVVYSFVCGPCGLAAFFVLHICGQLRILINQLKNITVGENLTDEVVRKRIALIVDYQIKTFKFLREVQVIIEQACLTEIVGSTLLLCLSGYCVIMEWESKNITSMMTYGVLSVSFGFSIFIWGYIGQLLNNESTQLYLASNTLDWYHLPPTQVKSVILINVMSSVTMKITAYKMMDMSLRSFANIMKAALAYLNMLRSLI